MKKGSWVKIKNSIIRLIIRKETISFKKWTELLEVCDTSYKCSESLYWATRGEAPEKIKVSLYNTLKIHTGNSFLHYRRLAEAAIGQNDKVTLSQTLEGMISKANEYSCLAWWEHIFRLMPENDKRKANIKWRIDKMRSARHRPKF